MGAPKQKWTAEEEAALKAGVLKHGTGKWRTILSDPEFSDVLRLRSNVDLKDKWRNINATAIWGSRQKAKLALKRGQLTAKPGDSPTISRPLPRSDFLRPELLPRPDNEIVDAKLIAVSGTPQSNDSKKPSDDSKKPIARLDNLILEAITSLKEPGGSERASIASYIEDQYLAPSNLKKLLGTKLKLMVENGSLTKINHKYRIPRGLTISEGRKSLPILLEGRQKGSPRILKEFKILTKAKVDADLSKMRSMTAEEAAAAAARAVAEAEVAIAEAEAAAREAEAAEAEAEAAEIFAKAAEKALKSRMVMA